MVGGGGWWVGGEAAHTQAWLWEPGPDTCLLPLEKMFLSIYKGSRTCSMGTRNALGRKGIMVCTKEILPLQNSKDKVVYKLTGLAPDEAQLSQARLWPLGIAFLTLAAQ